MAFDLFGRKQIQKIEAEKQAVEAEKQAVEAEKQAVEAEKQAVEAENARLVSDYTQAKVSFIDAISGYNGDKTGFFSGFGIDKDLRCIDLQTLQYRSLQLSRENPFVGAILGRLVTKVINTGLKLRAQPLEIILQDILKEGFLDDWVDRTECLFDIWSRDKRLVSVKGNLTLQNLERIAFRTACISGDCLIVKSAHTKLGTPVIQLIDGINIKSPTIYNTAEKDIVHGVEIDSYGREIAYYFENAQGAFQRISAFDSVGNRVAWLCVITEKRIDERRGLPLLSVILQNLNELGKYLDSEQRAALVNSYIAVVHTKSEGSPNRVNPLKNSGTNIENPDSTSSLKYKQMQPGFMATNLAYGEKVESFNTQRPNVNFNKFAEFITKINSYSLGIPPECLFLEFNSNYSASRQAKLELEDLISEKLAIFTTYFNQPVYVMWLDAMVLGLRIKAPKYINSMMNLDSFDIIGAWRYATWRGLKKSNVDGLKQAKELEICQNNGWMTAEQICDEYYDNDYKTNMRTRKKEAVIMKEVNDILEPVEKVDTSKTDIEDANERIEELENNKDANK